MSPYLPRIQTRVVATNLTTKDQAETYGAPQTRRVSQATMKVCGSKLRETREVVCMHGQGLLYVALHWTEMSVSGFTQGEA